MTVPLLLALLVLIPAAIALLADTAQWHRASPKTAYGIGVPVVYEHEEVSNCPASDAQDIRPAERGESYYYSIIDYLRVTEVLRDGRIVAVDRNNAHLCFWPDDSSLRKARLTERLLHPLRFPHS